MRLLHKMYKTSQSSLKVHILKVFTLGTILMFVLVSSLTMLVVDFVEDRLIHRFVEQVYFYKLSPQKSEMQFAANAKMYSFLEIPSHLRGYIDGDKMISEEFPVKNGSLHLYYNPNVSDKLLVVDVDENELNRQDYISVLALLFSMFVISSTILLYAYFNLFKRVNHEMLTYLDMLKRPKSIHEELNNEQGFEEIQQLYFKIGQLVNVASHSSNEFISHEIRNHLTIISSSSQMLARFPNREDIQSRYTLLIGSEIEKLSLVVNSVLALTRQKYQTKTCNRILSKEEVQCFINGDNLINTQSIHLSFFSAPSVCIEPILLELLVSNLVKNAARASSSEGVVHIVVKEYHISVIDHGVGISERSIPEGHGIGLAFVQEICDKHKIKFTLKNRVHTGKGCIASLSFRSFDEK